MKNSILTVILSALTLFGATATSEAGKIYIQTPGITFISGYRSCGTPVYKQRYVSGYNRCGAPIWRNRNVYVPQYRSNSRGYSYSGSSSYRSDRSSGSCRSSSTYRSYRTSPTFRSYSTYSSRCGSASPSGGRIIVKSRF